MYNEKRTTTLGCRRQIKKLKLSKHTILLTTLGLPDTALSGEQMFRLHVADVTIRLSLLAHPYHGPLSDLRHLPGLRHHAGVAETGLVARTGHAPVTRRRATLVGIHDLIRSAFAGLSDRGSGSEMGISLAVDVDSVVGHVSDHVTWLEILLSRVARKFRLLHFSPHPALDLHQRLLLSDLSRHPANFQGLLGNLAPVVVIETSFLAHFCL